jgi:hypothetical protein
MRGSRQHPRRYIVAKNLITAGFPFRQDYRNADEWCRKCTITVALVGVIEEAEDEEQHVGACFLDCEDGFALDPAAVFGKIVHVQQGAKTVSFGIASVRVEIVGGGYTLLACPN